MGQYDETNKQFYNELLSVRQEAEKEIRKYARKLEKLLTVSKEISSTTDLESIYRAVVEITRDIFRFDYSAIMILSDDKSRLVLQDTVGVFDAFPKSMIGKFSLVEGEGLATYVVKNKLPDMALDFSKEDRFKVPRIVLENHIVSALCVPLMVENDPFGVLIGHNIQKRIYSNEDSSLYQNIANMAAVAIKNSLNVTALKESEMKYRDLFENAIDPIFIVDPNLNYMDVNRKATEVFGYTREEFLRMNVYDVIPEEQIPKSEEEFRKLKEKGAYEKFIGRMRAKDGMFIDIEVSSSAIIDNGRVVGSRDIVRDITDRKRMEDEILKSQKLESIGTRAGGISHDFNNLLTEILGNINLAENIVEGARKEDERLLDAEKALLRARDLTQRLLAFSKGGEPMEGRP
jgi:two-component system NtrC family sensor kinase